MTREETLTIMGILKVAYPNFYRGMTRTDAEAAVGLWQDMFSDDPVEIVAAAVKALIASDEKGFPPHIGAVKEKMMAILEPDRMTEAEAWTIVSKALKRSAYNSVTEFEKLPDDLKRIVGSAAQLRDWSMMDSETVQSVVASNFQRSFRERRKQMDEYNALPGEVKAMIARAANQLAIGGGDE